MMAYFHFPNLSEIKDKLDLERVDGDSVNNIDHILTVNLENDLVPEEVEKNTKDYYLRSHETLEGKQLGGEEIKLYKNNSDPKWREIADESIPGLDLSYDYILRYRDTGGDLPGSPKAAFYGTNSDPLAIAQYLLENYTEDNFQVKC